MDTDTRREPGEGRMAELGRRFTDIGEAIDPSPVKDALSVLHAMHHELWRRLDESPAPDAEDRSALEHVASLHRSAPPMEGAATGTPLPVGTPAPDFELPDAHGTPLRLSSLRGRRVLLVFYPLDWSPGCSQQLDLYESERDAFERRGVQLLGVSVDSLYSHGAWAAVRGLGIPLLADFAPKGAVARRYGVYREKDGFSERALFLIDEEGVIRWTHLSPQLHHVPDLYVTFAALDALDASAPAGAARV